MNIITVSSVFIKMKKKPLKQTKETSIERKLCAIVKLTDNNHWLYNNDKFKRTGQTETSYIYSMTSLLYITLFLPYPG